MVTNTKPYAHKHVFYFWKLGNQSLMYCVGGEGAGMRGYGVKAKKWFDRIFTKTSHDYRPRPKAIYGAMGDLSPTP